MDSALSRQMFESCHDSSSVYIEAKSNQASISNLCSDLTCEGQVDIKERRHVI
jgi:hypothetical protein